MPVDAPPTRKRSYARWRAASLIAVYALMVVHIVHWKLAGRTLAPLELNEVLYTLELGVVTAGFLFMALAVLATAIFGRFFCSWACHILALQDLCSWLLAKVRIRPKPVRSRVLLLVPVFAMAYMFIWPHIVSAFNAQPRPEFHVGTDQSGWASFVTTDLWRNLPGPGVSIATFLVCGFVMVYVLGSRGFCTYGCPYGAIFAIADRVAPGKIKASGNRASCADCGLCTAACDSHIRVHHELTAFGRVVSPACLKDLDCVAACPTGNISFGIARPSGFLSWRTWGRFGVPYDFTLGEDLLMAAVFVGSLASLRGLYDTMPFFLSLGLAALLAFAAVLALRMATRANLRLNNFMLKRGGMLTRTGVAFAVAIATALAATVHSGFIRWHEVAGAHGMRELAETMNATGTAPAADALHAVIDHLETCRRWGLVRPAGLSLRLATAHCWEEKPQLAEPHVRRWLDFHPDDHSWRIMLAAILAARGDLHESSEHLRRVAESPSDADDAHAVRLNAVARQMLAELAGDTQPPHQGGPNAQHD
ncbi:MAG: 4Fe-4S binding protein [Phycisphaerae bacterium]|nr:4Fe-4S binding protein [Phycisphaerae bacterium]